MVREDVLAVCLVRYGRVGPEATSRWRDRAHWFFEPLPLRIGRFRHPNLGRDRRSIVDLKDFECFSRREDVAHRPLKLLTDSLQTSLRHQTGKGGEPEDHHQSKRAPQFRCCIPLQSEPQALSLSVIL